MSRGSTLNNYNYLTSNSAAMQHTDSNRFILSVRQQPVQARSSTNNEKDRRPVDPPPIVQIELDNTNTQESQHFLQNPYLFMCVSLADPDTLEEIVSISQNILSGQTTSSMYKLKDVNNQDGGFFVFGDLSVKSEGKFRLKFSVFSIDEMGVTNLKSTYSDIFQVYSTKNFPGMLESTFLSRSFSDQGARIRIRKEHRVQMVSSRKRKLSSADKTLEQNYQNKLDYSMNYQDTHSVMTSHPYPKHVPYLQSHNTRNIYQTNGNEKRRQSVKDIPKRESLGFASPYLPSQQLRSSIPFSPPHQYYDPYLIRAFSANLEHYNSHRLPQNTFMLSPPPQYSFVQKSEQYRRSSFDERTAGMPSRRNASSDNEHFLSINHRRMSLQPSLLSPFASHPVGKGPIHLPPLRSVIRTTTLDSPPPNPTQEGLGEVDAAVAMMQLASLKRSKGRKTAGFF
ncbi:hypothetical protein G6F55_002553 [Rhizopus delemar]|nr:hypothetical protein G6F55_002553 [Rhizopus delemar]KAG1525777.1 hypothetical protein G6F52_003026 [Rhizopus delemar]KAG1547918.1 hypothetical protein G6F51_003984 [Rhizopus arrhizus]KAG1576051.1 hypothetical protein G6F50_000547 [Rhizopus delemar]KAG1633357.1 hypothetical protein G6F45_003487 [Rhizopus arrhizus]